MKMGEGSLIRDKLLWTQLGNKTAKILDLKMAEEEKDLRKLDKEMEVMEEICKYCTDLEKEDETCPIGCNLIVLFPSLTSKRTCEIKGERILRSSLEFK